MRYAKALFEFASGDGAETLVYKEALTLRDHFARLPELVNAVNNPVITADVKWKLLCEAAGGNVTEQLSRFIRLVLKERRENVLQFMMNSYIDIYRKKKKISIGTLITAYPVADEVTERIRKIVTDATRGTLEFITRVDPELEGGFIFEIGTYRLNASVADQMRRIKNQFIDKNRRIV